MMAIVSRIFKLALYITAFMATAGIAAYFSVHLMIRSENVAVVPDLMGKEAVYALEVLSDLKLNTKVKRFEFSDDIPKHHVIAQDPEPGREIKQGRDVRLVLSRGTPTVILPSVVDTSLPMATILITENDLRVGKTTRTFASAPKETIVAQYPSAGQIGHRGSLVDLLVSAGPAGEPVKMMNVNGVALDHAVGMIEKAGLELGHIHQRHRTNLANDAVIDQQPQAGEPVLPGSSVNLTINRPKNQPSSTAQNSALFRYRLPMGFLRKKVRVKISRANHTINLVNRFAKPGEEIWLLILKDEPTTLFLHIDDALILTRYYQ